jgi:outer membrane protein
MEAFMTRWKTCLVFLCLAGVTSVAYAQASPGQANPQNIVTLSFNAAVLQTAEAQKNLSALQARYAPKQKQLQALNDEVESLRKQLEQQPQ